MSNRIFIKQLLQKLFSAVLLTSILSGAFSVSAQTRRKSSPKRQTTAEVEKKICANCWSGKVTFVKKFEDSVKSDEPVFGTLSPNAERVTHDDSRNYEYTAAIRVDGSGGQPHADAEINYDERETQIGSVTEYTRCHNFENDRLITETNETKKTTGGEGNMTNENFDVAIFGDDFRFGVRLPDVPGKYATKNIITRKNFCSNSTRKPTETSENSDITKISGEIVSVEGKIDPKNPDEISGTKTWIDKPESLTSTTTYTIKYKLTRKPIPLMITDVKFYQPRYPSPNSWAEIDDARGESAIDGNQVKIVATILNLSNAEKTASVNFKELIENTDLPDSGKPETFKPREEKEVELIWDTSGFAWKEANIWNQPQIDRQIEVKIPDDALTENIEVKPKPVLIVPGLWSKRETIAKFGGFFANMRNAGWIVRIAPIYVKKYAVENMAIIDKAIRDLQQQENAWHIDLVAHSTGGLAARSYVHSLMPMMFDGRPTATHLVMIGTPNMGTPCATGVDDILTKVFKNPPGALSEVTIRNMKIFNRNVTDRKGTKFSALVGNAFAPICQMDAPGDGITPNISAIWSIKDWKFSNSRAGHEEMPGEESNFQQVVNWLAVPPKGNHAPDTSASNGNYINENVADLTETNFGQARNYGAMFHGANFVDDVSGEDESEPGFTTGIKLAANSSTEIEIPVTNGSRFSMILYTTSNISATLIDNKDEIVGKSLAETPEAGVPFRTITVKKTFQNGKWKLKLENRAVEENEVAVTIFIDYKSIFSANKEN